MWAAVHDPLGVEKVPKEKVQFEVTEPQFEDGDRRGVGMFAATTLKVSQFGVYSINVYLDGQRVAFLPLKIVKKQA